MNIFYLTVLNLRCFISELLAETLQNYLQLYEDWLLDFKNDLKSYTQIDNGLDFSGKILFKTLFVIFGNTIL